jgi:ABC-type branched-subunit amino acid transport system ATPase component
MCAFGRGLRAGSLLLLLDEPSLALASSLVEQVFPMMHGIAADGSPLLLAALNPIRRCRKLTLQMSVREVRQA